jgi:hypothetical protein
MDYNYWFRSLNDDFDEVLAEISEADKILLEYAVTGESNRIH